MINTAAKPETQGGASSAPARSDRGEKGVRSSILEEPRETRFIEKKAADGAQKEKS